MNINGFTARFEACALFARSRVRCFHRDSHLGHGCLRNHVLCRSGASDEGSRDAPSASSGLLR